jgi:hypothetical protein
VKLVALVLAAFAVALAAWATAEFHYQSCVTAAEARTPTILVPADPDELLSETFITNREARTAVEGCSRTPW